MRYGVIADVHGNLAAFETVARHLANLDEIWFLGDIVGYGPSPNECVDLLISLDAKCVLGNHDAGALGEIGLGTFNPDARKALEWTATQLAPESKEFLSGLPLREKPLNEVTLVHGSPREPIWEYIYTAPLADENLDHFKTDICFIGHSHLPLIFIKSPNRECQMVSFGREGEVPLRKGFRYIINPGSVGQPRDGNPKTSYLVFDSEKFTLEYHRLKYPIEETQRLMEKEDLPEFLIERLSSGA